MLVQASHSHHEGSGELVTNEKLVFRSRDQSGPIRGQYYLVTPGGSGAGRVVALQHSHELSALVLDEVPVLSPDGVDLKHVTNLVPGLLDLY